jgi:hypothetical protein
MTHTPGPWKAIWNEDKYAITGDGGKANCLIATLNKSLMLHEQEKDAFLIAAAPRMYDALRLFVDWHDTLLKGNTKKISVQRMHRFVSIAQDAINEIEGRE